MAWYANHYHCDECNTGWVDEWSCCCDDDCPACGARHWSPFDSDDLTFVIEEADGVFEIYVSPILAEHEPDYELVAVALSKEAANGYVAHLAAMYWK